MERARGLQGENLPILLRIRESAERQAQEANWQFLLERQELGLAPFMPLEQRAQAEEEVKFSWLPEVFRPRTAEREAEEPQSGNMIFSDSGADFLMRREAPWQPWYRITDEYGKITHILPHTLRDGGVTFGFGIHFPHGSPEIQTFQYAMPVNEARERMLERVQDDVEAINNWLSENNITVTQNQFDALVTHRYNRGNIGRLLPYLLSGDFDREALFAAMIEGVNPYYVEGLTNRYNEELEIFLNSNYNVGPQFQFDFD